MGISRNFAWIQASKCKKQNNNPKNQNKQNNKAQVSPSVRNKTTIPLMAIKRPKGVLASRSCRAHRSAFENFRAQVWRIQIIQFSCEIASAGSGEKPLSQATASLVINVSRSLKTHLEVEFILAHPRSTSRTCNLVSQFHYFVELEREILNDFTWKSLSNGFDVKSLRPFWIIDERERPRFLASKSIAQASSIK